MNNFKLFKNICLISEDKINFENAKNEWEIISIYDENDNECVCGHNPITECILIKNKFNNNETIIGNCCIKILLNKDFSFIFKDLKKISKNISKSLSKKGINYYYSIKLFNEYEYEFYKNTRLIRELTQNRINKRIEINNKVIKYFKKYIN